MDDAIRKAEALIEARSYIRMFRDRLTVIKLGGSAMEDAAALEATLQDVVFMETVGMRADPRSRRRQTHRSRHGRVRSAAAQDPGPPLHRRGDPRHRRPRPARKRSTPASSAQIRRLGGRAVGLHSGSLQSLFGERLRLPGADGQPIDLGRVGG